MNHVLFVLLSLKNDEYMNMKLYHFKGILRSVPALPLGEIGSHLGHHSSGLVSGASKIQNTFFGHKNIFDKTLSFVTFLNYFLHEKTFCLNKF